MEEMPGKDQVEQFVFPGTKGSPILLTSLGEIEETTSPVQITRVDKQRVSKLIANLEEGKALGTAVGELTSALKEKGELPPGYSFAFKGQYEIMAEGQIAILE
jgi:multidrug efflux pump subunit AcrB